jgi:hypothetical protein
MARLNVHFDMLQIDSKDRTLKFAARIVGNNEKDEGVIVDEACD